MSDANNDIVLGIKDIHKSFDKLEVLQGINMQVRRGEVVAVIGPSGGGKSTLYAFFSFLRHNSAMLNG